MSKKKDYKIAVFPQEDKIPYFLFFLENVSVHIEEELNANSIFPVLIRLFLPVDYDQSTCKVTVSHYVKPEEKENVYFGGPLADREVPLPVFEKIIQNNSNLDIYLFSDDTFAGIIQLCRVDFRDTQRNFINQIIPRLTKSFHALSKECQETIQRDAKLTVLENYFREIIRKIENKIREIMPTGSNLTFSPWIEINYGTWKPVAPPQEPNEVVLRVVPHPDQKEYIEWLNVFLFEFAKKGYFEKNYESYLEERFYEKFHNYSWGLHDPVQAPQLLFKAHKAKEPQITYTHNWESHTYVYDKEYEAKYGLEKLFFKNSQAFFLIAYPPEIVVAIVTRKGDLNKPHQEEHQKKIERELQKEGHINALKEILYLISKEWKKNESNK